MNVLNLTRIDLQSDLETLGTLPVPENSPLKAAKNADLYAVHEHFNELWQRLLIKKEKLPNIEIAIKGKDKSTLTIEGEELWDRTLMVVAIYYDYAFRNYVTSQDKMQNFPKSLALASFNKFVRKGDKENSPKSFTLKLFSYFYFLCIFELYFIKVFRSLPSPLLAGPTGVFEGAFHRDLKRLYELSQQINRPHLEVMGKRLTQGVLEYAEFVYSDEPVWNKEHKPGAFSALRLSELSLLAKRDISIAKRYGEQNIAKVFENQLALLIQSFGLYVMSTRVASKTVDLVCVSSDPTYRLTFLIEAKTTKGAYSLPSKDSRALRDYIDDIGKSLITLPPLSFVLLIGPQPSKTVESKIAELESQVGIPVRYCHAQQIADLREQINGLLPIKVFREQVIKSSRVLSDNFVDVIVASYKAEQEAHVKFMEAMLSARGITPFSKGIRKSIGFK